MTDYDEVETIFHVSDGTVFCDVCFRKLRRGWRYEEHWFIKYRRKKPVATQNVCMRCVDGTYSALIEEAR